MADSRAAPASGATRLRVLMTADCVGGVFTYALVLANELARAGAVVHLATMGDALRPEQREAIAAVPSLVVHESTHALEWMNDPWADVDRAGEWLLALEREIRPDVVHLNGYAHGDLPFEAPVVVVGHSCVLSWWEAVLGESAPSSWDTYRARVRRGVSAARVVIAPSAAMLGALEKHYGPIKCGLTVHNGLPPAGLAASAAALREPFVLAAGRVWDEAKNLPILSRIAPRLPWQVRVAGSDAHPDGTSRPLPGVTSLGWVAPEALGRLMERASMFVHPARYEPFGLGPLEAAQRGCALVLSDIESLREIWADAAMFVPPNDEDALVHAISDLANDELLRARMASRAKARSLRFTAEAMARGTLAAYARAGVTKVTTRLLHDSTADARTDSKTGGDACAS